MTESVDKNFQIATINMLKDSKEYMNTNQMKLVEIQTEISQSIWHCRGKKEQWNTRQSKLKQRDNKKKT